MSNHKSTARIGNPVRSTDNTRSKQAKSEAIARRNARALKTYATPLDMAALELEMNR